MDAPAAPPPAACAEVPAALPLPPAVAADAPARTRKPYTITKQRECWTDAEHARFLEALKLHGRAWRRIEEHVGSKTAVQIRSHAQKYFLKVQKNDTGERVPPPRPKRRAVQPYPQKVAGAPAPAAAPWPPGLAPGDAPPPPPPQLAAVLPHPGLAWPAALAFPPAPPPPDAAFPPQLPAALPLPSTPDFAAIYVFLAAVMDPVVSPPAPAHLSALRAMSPLDRETAVLLMHHLVRNLTSRAMWETQMKLVCEGKPSFITAHAHTGSGGWGGGGVGHNSAAAQALPAAEALPAVPLPPAQAAPVHAVRPPRPAAPHAVGQTLYAYARPMSADAPHAVPAAAAPHAGWQHAPQQQHAPPPRPPSRDGAGISGESPAPPPPVAPPAAAAVKPEVAPAQHGGAAAVPAVPPAELQLQLPPTLAHALPQP